jgi:hypothetical protein
MTNQIIVVGGGPSISEGIREGLWEKIQGKWTVGCNSIFKFFTPTLLTFLDYPQFYKLFFDELKALPLIVGRASDYMREYKHQNTILLNDSFHYDRTLQSGVYSGQLCGLFATTLATHFLENGGEIFLLGMDFGATVTTEGKALDGIHKPLTHFYQGNNKFHHPGIGYIGFYHKERRLSVFDPYAKLPNIKVWNVSKQSRLPQFEKISYCEFFKKLNPAENQGFLRNFIVDKLKLVSHYYWDPLNADV